MVEPFWVDLQKENNAVLVKYTNERVSNNNMNTFEYKQTNE